MRLFAKWILAGIAAGALSGTIFGWPYVLAGAGIGAAAGLGIALGLRPGAPGAGKARKRD